MAGLIANQMSPASSPELDAKLSPQAIMASLHLNPQQKQQLLRIVAAGMKVMFDPKTHQMMLQALQGPGPLPDKMGKGVAGLMGLLLKEANNSIPPTLIVPAGLVLLAHAADFMKQSGMPVSSQDFGGAVDVFVSTVMDAYGLDPDKVAAIAGGADTAAGGSGVQPGAAAPPSAPAPGGM